MSKQGSQTQAEFPAQKQPSCMLWPWPRRSSVHPVVLGEVLDLGLPVEAEVTAVQQEQQGALPRCARPTMGLPLPGCDAPVLSLSTRSLLRLLPPPLPRPPLLLPRLPLLLMLPSRLKPLLLMLPSPQWTLARPLLKPPRSNISCFSKTGLGPVFIIVRFVLSHATPIKSLIRGHAYPVKWASQRTRRCANGHLARLLRSLKWATTRC